MAAARWAGWRWVRLVSMLGFLVVGATAAVGAPPRVVSASPDNGDIDVDPSTGQLVIVFDQPMNRSGFSVVGGGESFPEITGQGRWRNARTFVLPIRLKPDHGYVLSINNQQFTNFRSVRDEAAVPYPIRFRTGSAAAERAEAGGGHAEAVDLLLEALTKHYSHRDKTATDWAAEIEGARATLEASASPRQFAQRVATLLSKAQDKHIWVDIDGQRLPTFSAPAVPNVDPRTLPVRVPNWKQHSRAVSSGRFEDGVGYVWIETWDRAREGEVMTAHEAIDSMLDAPAIIIDVRGNGGGDELLAQSVASRFVPQRTIYARHDWVDAGSPTGFTEPVDRVIAPSETHERYGGRVIVLTGAVVMSSGEAFVLMMRDAAGATTVGGHTQGSSGNPGPNDLGNGVVVYLPRWRAMTVEGQRFEGAGLAPDVPVEVTAVELAGRDPVLEAGLREARE